MRALVTQQSPERSAGFWLPMTQRRGGSSHDEPVLDVDEVELQHSTHVS